MRSPKLSIVNNFSFVNILVLKYIPCQIYCTTFEYSDTMRIVQTFNSHLEEINQDVSKVQFIHAAMERNRVSIQIQIHNSVFCSHDLLCDVMKTFIGRIMEEEDTRMAIGVKMQGVLCLSDFLDVTGWLIDTGRYN